MGLDSNGRPLSEGGSGAVPLSADFGSIQANIFTPICSVCHIGASAPQGLRLDADNSYNLLVGVPSTEVPSILRVKPGDPDNSYIIQKLEGHAAVGGQMPLGETPLPAATIAFIRQWITDGAQPAASTMVMAAAAFQITAVAPQDADVLSAAPAQIVIGFTRELDATRADATAVRLERVIRAGSSESAVNVPIVVSVPPVNPRALLLTPQRPLSLGVYQVVLSGAPGTELSALDGERLSAASVNAASALARGDRGADRVIARFTVSPSP